MGTVMQTKHSRFFLVKHSGVTLIGGTKNSTFAGVVEPRAAGEQ
jgi:hypothetical protein